MRDPTIIKWPRGQINPRNIVPQIDLPSWSGPSPLVGRPQVVVSPAAGWRLTYEGVPFNKNNRSSYFPILDRIAGFAEPIYVGPYDYASDAVARAGVARTSLYTFVGPYLFTGGYYFEASITDCTLAAAASMGATEISVTNSATAPLQPGDYFEIDGRLHRIVSIYLTTWKIWPGLRADYASGTWLEISDPRMKAYLTPESQALASRMIMGRYGDATLEFVEAGC
jgi:hypothetical protein